MVLDVEHTQRRQSHRVLCGTDSSQQRWNSMNKYSRAYCWSLPSCCHVADIENNLPVHPSTPLQTQKHHTNTLQNIPKSKCKQCTWEKLTIESDMMGSYSQKWCEKAARTYGHTCLCAEDWVAREITPQLHHVTILPDALFEVNLPILKLDSNCNRLHLD